MLYEASEPHLLATVLVDQPGRGYASCGGDGAIRSCHGHLCTETPLCPIMTTPSCLDTTRQGQHVCLTRCNFVKLHNNPGALLGTINKGLRPAMNLLFRHHNDPIHNVTSKVTVMPCAQPHNEQIGKDDNEDAAAQSAACGLRQGAAGKTELDTGVKAQVSRPARHLTGSG